MNSIKKKVCFLDRDGVINIDRGHITNKKQIFIYPDIFEILRYLINNEYIIIVIIILFLLYLWAELGVGIFFQDSWGGD